MRIKDLIPVAHTFCKYTWEVIVYMVITGKVYARPNIWPEIPEQAKKMEDIRKTI